MTRPGVTRLVVALAMGAVPLAKAPAQPPPPAAQAPLAGQPPALQPEAVAILKAAGETLAEAASMSFTALNTYERPAVNGQPLYYTTLNQVTLRRPDKLRVITPGDGTADEFYYDGKTMVAFVPEVNLAAVAEAPPSIDELVDAAWEKAAIYFPFSDVIMSDPYADMAKTMTSAFVVGQSKVVGGTVTDMVAVASPTVQAEIWIGKDDHLPRMVRVVYPNEPGHARYQTDFSDWRLGDAVSDDAFASEPARHAMPVPFAPPGPGTAPGASQAAPAAPKQP
ncbi:DUF2092 domain-containing protein [Limobrevibacterium gyesilva]|uniref:DUF2092 domain-containing protein n=1 Tax=Limobrevibacterium gyesilva TaxID=2991712 RepID=A0AA41YQW8_9PROT|nr:DUF2092 domain-containing protein [Limobrevibacterium gyesilva]MCW3476638.1 DUF2092 domain-containing protein [Limobrevibacterium gyesilva]